MKMRRITSLTMLVSLVPLLLTSVILYIEPEGRVAYWSDWKILGLSKPQWGDIHINLGWLFLVAGLLHIFYNWISLVVYLKNSVKKITLFTPEFTIGFLLTLGCIVGTLLYVPPFSSVLEFGASFKDAAAVKYGEPPYGHAELSSLKTFSRRTDLELGKMMDELDSEGIRYTGEEQSLLEIARANGINPKQVYEILKKSKIESGSGEVKVFPDAPFPGFGKLSLEIICQEYGLDVGGIIKGFTEKGVTAKPFNSLKDIGEANGSDPHKLFEILYEIQKQ